MKMKEAIIYLMSFSGNLLEKLEAKISGGSVFCRRLEVGTCRTQVWRDAATELRTPISCNAVAM